MSLRAEIRGKKRERDRGGVSLERPDSPLYVASPEYVGEAAAKFLDRDAEIQRPILEEIGVTKKKNDTRFLATLKECKS
jgi:hypothetical protein